MGRINSVIVDLRQRLNAQKKKHSNAGNRCHYCGGAHKIRVCEKLLKFSIIDRRREVAKRNLCQNCLMPIRGQHKCSFGPCKVCGNFEFHNSILCFMSVQ